MVAIEDHVQAGDVLCIVEAMKMFNNIQATYSWVVKARLVEDAQSVDFGQPLFIIDRSE